MCRRLVVSVNPVHARHVRENDTATHRRPSGESRRPFGCVGSHRVFSRSPPGTPDAQSVFRQVSSKRYLVGRVCVARTWLLRRPKMFFLETYARTSDILSSVPAYVGHDSCRAVYLGLLLGSYLVGRVCVACTRLLRRPKMFSRRKAFLEALSRIVCTSLFPIILGETLGIPIFSNFTRFSVCVRETSPCVVSCYVFRLWH